MPADQFTRVNLDYIYPPLLMRVMEVIAVLRKSKLRFVATHGFRSFAEQDALFDQRPKVTNARGGESQHNYGLAFDFVYDVNPNTPKVEPGWASPMYEPLVREVIKSGLHSGVNYNDSPHVGWPRLVSGEELKALKLIYESTTGDELTKLKAVWQYVDSLGIKLPDYP
jgi:hypothetical protein